MRDRYSTLRLRHKLAGALLTALAGGLLGLEAGAAPAIASISPERGTNTTRVTIAGTGFGSSGGTSTVTFGGREASRYHQWSDTEIEVSPPSSLPYGAGAVVVTVGGAASNGATYTRLGVLTAFCALGGGRLSEPAGTFDVGVHRSGPVTEAVTVALSYRGRATHGADYTAPESLALAAGERTGTGTLTVLDDAGREGPEQIVYGVSAEGYISDSCALTLGDDDPEGAPAPWISGLDPTSAGAGVSVTITGLSFGAAKGTSTVTFNGTPAATTSWSATSIAAVVPAGAATGRVLVTVGGQVSNGVGFTVTPAPSIGGIDPTSGVPGTGVVITGANFGARKRFSTVTFNGAPAATTTWSDTSIAAVAPAGARSGDVVVRVGGVASNGVPFTVIAPVRLACPSSVSEPSGMGEITARVDSGYEPATGVTFAVTHAGTAKEGTDYTVGRLAIASGRRSGRMDPKLRVVDDSLPEGEETIELRVKAAGYEEAGCTIRLTDDEPWISGLEPAAGPAGGPVAISGSSFGAAKGTSTVAFNGTPAATTGWSATSIAAVVPAGATAGDVVVTVGGKASNGAPFTVTGVTVDPTELTVEEGGEGTYTVVLDSKPASAVTVSMFAPEGTDLSVDILPVFTPADWNEPQTVTVTAGEDDDRVDEVDTIVHRTASADGSYHNLAVDPVEVTVSDNDAGAGVRVDPVELTIEEGETGAYTVVLNEAPSAEVTVAVTAGGDLTVDSATLTFTTEDWSTAQTVTVTAGEDDDAEDETETLAHAVTSTDEAYSGLAVDGVKVTIADDEGTGGPGGTEELTVSTTRLRITEGNMGKYTVVLNRAPASSVTVAVAAPSGGDLTVSPARLDFTASNWDTPQEVRVEAGQDSDLADEVESITHTIRRAATGSSSSLRDGLWRDAAFAAAMASPAPTREYVYLGGRLAAISEGGAVGEVSVVVTIDDDDDPDTPGVPALTNSLRLTEGHTGAYTLELGAAPTSDVAIALSVSRGSDNAADVTVRPARLTFTPSNWDAPQWITVSVGRDDDTVGETEVISHAAGSADSRYEGIAIPDVSVVIRDRNRSTTPEGTLTAIPNPCTIAAGQTTCSTTLAWTSMHVGAIQIRKIIGQDNRVVITETGSRVGRGDTRVTGIGLTDTPYYLYEYITSTQRRGQQLATVTVTGVQALSLSPASGPVGTVVTITGSGFGDSRGTGAN
ncbi:MAG: IPT/TIG domain-containing protein, partial [Acidobacteriota bacterium]|nr:IPT/TIG domain-containing protein [Acidobacteriota bacterium]